MIYTLEIYKGDSRIFAHDILLDASQKFGEQIESALHKFRLNFPGVGLFDDDVRMHIGKADR
nr:hypothetical protein [Brucella intermedia]